MEAPITPAEQAYGEQMMHEAMLLTKFRAKSSPVLGAIVALTPENWVTTAVGVVEIVSDVLDGWRARKGAEVLGIETTPAGAIDDPKADKKFINSMLVGLTVRYLRQANWLAAGTIAVNALTSHWRDGEMQLDRTLVEHHKLDPNELKALKINKCKMAAQAAAVIALASPPARRPRVHYAGLALLTAGTVLGIVGERKYRKRVHSLIAAKSAVNIIKSRN